MGFIVVIGLLPFRIFLNGHSIIRWARPSRVKLHLSNSHFAHHARRKKPRRWRGEGEGGLRGRGRREGAEIYSRIADRWKDMSGAE